MVDRIYLGPKSNVEAMLRGAFDELARWLACAPRLDLSAVDLTDRHGPSTKRSFLYAPTS